MNSSRVIFNYKGLANFGEEVRIVGSCVNLGMWNPGDGASLATNPNIYPNWETPAAINLPMHTEIEYKYVFYSKTNTRWEEHEFNRKLRVDT